MASGRLRCLCDISNHGDLAPGAKGNVASGAVLIGGEATATELEVAVDVGVSCPTARIRRAERHGRGTAPTQRDRPLQRFAEHGRIAWQNASGYNKRFRVEAAMNQWKQVIGDELRAHTV